MNPERFIGTWPMRFTALLLLVGCVVGWNWYVSQGAESGLFIPNIVLSVLAFVAFVHTGRPVYALWMQVAGKIQATVVTLLFSVTYLVLVPPFWLFARTRDSLKQRNAETISTYWVNRLDEERTVEFFQRLG